ncbi:low affinity iron permease family protein [Hyphomicrobium sp. 99]|uniref:low affinity iron permease family protein n=1 Tax=Hyphomicrobium sp. 99 TaxID=1163419 RepID=UPI001FD97BBE|nr:low affinity iron permease family protein [Hyphomicrobium sp. 99]
MMTIETETPAAVRPQSARLGWRQRVMHSFSQFAGRSALVIGSASAFVVATLSVVLWAATGPYFHYSDTWQLVVNTGTTLVTFLAVFLIQHSQNKDGKAIQLKLDELIRSTQSARNILIDLEHATEDEIEKLQKEFARRRHS